MAKKLKFKLEITRVKLNPEQAVLSCTCYMDVGGGWGYNGGHSGRYTGYELVSGSGSPTWCNGGKGTYTTVGSSRSGADALGYLNYGSS
jgi:hypothetical protein